MARSRLLGVQHPLGNRLPAPDVRPAYAFLPTEGESLHQIPVGPVHAGIIEPGHFRFTASGETVVRLEQRLGYVHKGIELLIAGASIERAAKLAARTSGDSTVAYGIAFAHAVEAASGVEAPPRARYLRALMAELEAARQSFRRYRRHLQRRLVFADARPLRRAARAGFTRRGKLFRASADDGPGGSRRRCGRSPH